MKMCYSRQTKNGRFLDRLPYVHHYSTQLVYFLPHLSVRLILQTIYVTRKCSPKIHDFKSRVGFNGTCTIKIQNMCLTHDAFKLMLNHYFYNMSIFSIIGKTIMWLSSVYLKRISPQVAKKLWFEKYKLKGILAEYGMLKQSSVKGVLFNIYLYGVLGTYNFGKVMPWSLWSLMMIINLGISLWMTK